MKFSHGVGFFVIGAAMLVLPLVAPGLCPRNGFDGTSGRELWLQIMGCLQTGMGLTSLVKASMLAVVEWLASWREILAETSEAEVVEPALEWATLQPENHAPVVAVDFGAPSIWTERKAA
jgi:hypothetical protein